MQLINTPEFWREEFEVTDDDLEYLYMQFVEEGIPRTTSDLVHLLIRRRVNQTEKTRHAQRRAEGVVYQPKESYEVGQRLTFPALGDQVTGEVIDIRDGENPEYGDFKVIRVKMGGDGIREFAAEFSLPHVLNIEEKPVNVKELYEVFGEVIREALVEQLSHHPEFVRYGDEWLLKGLLVDIHVGYLNIAEAMIVVAGEPMPTERLLEEVELPEDIPMATRVFSLNRALAHDDRFTNVGAISQPLWSLAYAEEETA